MKKLISSGFIFFLFFDGIGQQKISIDARPAKIWIEQGEDHRYINFDFVVSNLTNDSLSLSKLAILVFDKNNRLIYTRFIDNNGTAPSINLIPNRIIKGQSTELIFNPFPEFSKAFPLVKLVYEWTFKDNKDNEVKINNQVSPALYLQKPGYRFPLKGKVLIYDGHDLYAHHRRFDYEFAPIKNLGFHSNFMRYAYDFVLVDINNNQFTHQGSDKDYFGWGKPVFAVGDGKVIYVSDTHEDDKTFDIPGMTANPLELYGNCIAIEHADNSVSVYGHLKHNSCHVKRGQMVKQQQEIASIGVSGSSFFPHLHFEMRTSISHTAEGIPSYFSNINSLEGGIKRKLKSGLAETGNIIETE
ncbi:MAG: M23 family metallopeptidase [Ginsengibacter sp.]